MNEEKMAVISKWLGNIAENGFEGIDLEDRLAIIVSNMTFIHDIEPIYNKYNNTITFNIDFVNKGGPV